VTSVETQPLIADSLARIATALEQLAEIARYRYLPVEREETNREDEDA
jgi:hypothetical protein